MSKLLINEPPLQVLPSLALKIGLKEAIILQQIHYWQQMPKMGRVAEGRKWIRNSMKEWQKDNFPFWSKKTISRTLASLEKRGLIVSCSTINKHGYDRTKWYSIDRGQLDNLSHCNETSCPDAIGQSDATIPETTAENTQKEEKEPPSHNQNSNGQPPPIDPIAQELVILDLYRKNITPAPGSIEIDHIVSDIGDLSQAGYNAWDVFEYAITQAVGANARKLNYIQAIVKDIRDSNTPLEAYIEGRQAKGKQRGHKNGVGNGSQATGWLGLSDDQKRHYRAIAKAEGAPPEALSNDETMTAWYEHHLAALQKAIKQNDNS